jgi:hypothetical protein
MKFSGTSPEPRATLVGYLKAGPVWFLRKNKCSYWLTFPDSVSEMRPRPYPFLRSLLPDGIKYGLADNVAAGVVEPWTFLFLLDFAISGSSTETPGM